MRLGGRERYPGICSHVTVFCVLWSCDRLVALNACVHGRTEVSGCDVLHSRTLTCGRGAGESVFRLHSLLPPPWWPLHESEAWPGSVCWTLRVISVGLGRGSYKFGVRCCCPDLEYMLRFSRPGSSPRACRLRFRSSMRLPGLCFGHLHHRSWWHLYTLRLLFAVFRYKRTWLLPTYMAFVVCPTDPS